MQSIALSLSITRRINQMVIVSYPIYGAAVVIRWHRFRLLN